MGRTGPLASFARAIAATTFALAASACSDIVDSLAHEDDRPVPNEVELVPVLPVALIPSLLVHVDGAGLLRFPLPNMAADELPLDTAIAQAREFQFYALNVFLRRNSAENERGAFIDLGKLAACGRPHLARSVFERPPASLSRGLQVQLGGRWYIPFCGEYDGPETVTTVATLGNQVRYRNARAISDSAFQHLAFQVHGVRWEWKTEQMVTPEEAVNEAYAATGLRATRLPELTTAELIDGRRANNSGICPVWRISLERQLLFVTMITGRVRLAADVYVTDSDCPGVIGRPVLLVPLLEQPVTREVRVTLRDSTSTTGFRTESYVARYTAPVSFESAAAAR